MDFKLIEDTVDGYETIMQNTDAVRKKNQALWLMGDLKERMRGSTWTVYLRLLYDFRNLYDDRERERKGQMPYVDTLDWMYTSRSLIASSLAFSIAPVTVGRQIEKLRKIEVNGKVLIKDVKNHRNGTIKVLLNKEFFVFKELKKKSEESKKNDDQSDRLRKFARKFNKKNHIR